MHWRRLEMHLCKTFPICDNWSINRGLRKSSLEIGGISLSNFSRSTQMITPSERIHFRSIIFLFSNGITSIPKQILRALSPISRRNSQQYSYSCRERTISPKSLIIPIHGMVRSHQAVTFSQWNELQIKSLTAPVLNIVRFGRDISRYLFFCLQPIRYGKIIHHIVYSKKDQYLKYQLTNRPKYLLIWNNLFIARLCANVHFFFLCMHITSFLLGIWYLWH